MPSDFVMGAFHGIAVVARAFDDTRAGALAAFPVRPFIDFRYGAG